MMPLPLEQRVRGALLGAAIGAQLGLGPVTEREKFGKVTPETVFDLELTPFSAAPLEPGRQNSWPLTPLIDLGVRAFVEKGGRVTPEDFGRLFRDDAGVAVPVFLWDGLHTSQELLKEGMQPRVAGMGNAPCGLICAAMPAVGIYHHHDPDYAYVDGMELAAVTQPRVGSDWAGLCAATVAAAFAEDATPASIMETVLRIAHRVNKDVYYQLNLSVGQEKWAGDDTGFARWWLNPSGPCELTHDNWWVAPNPARFVLPLLTRFAGNPRKFFALLVSTPPTMWLDSSGNGKAVSCVIGGAVLGALYGPDHFPAAWREAAADTAACWEPLLAVVRERAKQEERIVAVTERLIEPTGGEMNLLQEKIYACMLAGAIGNAMGSLTENQFSWEIDQAHPGGIQSPLDPSRLESEDDNQMAMLLFETYLAEEGRPVMARQFGRTWIDRLNRHHFFTLCMGNAYDLLRQGWDPRITGHWSQVTGSTVMCMEPVGVYHLADPEYAAIDAAAISYMYQRGRDVVAAAILAAAVAEALRPDASVDSVLHAALNASPRAPMMHFDQRKYPAPYDYLARCLEVADGYTDVFAVRQPLYDECLLYHMIDPLELLGFALAMFKVTGGDVRLCAIGGTNIGRDADTIAGRGAMLAGTLRGPSNIPAEWIALFKQDSLDRIRRNAVRLADQIAEKRLARLRARRTEAVTMYFGDSPRNTDAQ